MSGPQPLQLSEIREYMDMQGLRTTEDRRRFARYIQALDDVYLENHYGDGS